MPTRPIKDLYSNQASEVDTRMSATIRAANELQMKTQEIDKQKHDSLQIYHQRRRELKDFLAGLYSNSGNHVVIPNEEIADEIRQKTEKKPKLERKDGEPPKQKRHQTTAAKFLSTSGAGGLNALGTPMSEDDTESSSDDDSDISGSKQSNGSTDLNKNDEREIGDDDEAYRKTRALAVTKLPNISKHNPRRRTVPNIKMDRKFDIAKFRRRFSNFDRSAAYDGFEFARNNIDDDGDNGIHPPPLTRSTLASLESKPTELRAKIQQWCDSINEDWFYSKDYSVQSKTDQTGNVIMKPENDKKANPDHHPVKTSESQLLRLPSTFPRSNSHQRSPLPSTSQSRSRRPSHVNLQVPRHLRVHDKSKTDADDDLPCDIELVDGGFGLVGTRVVKRASLPVSRLVKDGDRAGDPLVPGNRNSTSHIDKRVHFDVNDRLNNVPTMTRMSSITRPKSQCRTKSDSGVDDLEFEIKLSIRNSSDHVNGDDIHAIKRSHHSCHECKVYRGRDTRAMSLADPLTLDRMAQAQTRVVQRQRARMRRESYSYSASASIDAALRYNQMKWSM